MTMCTTMWQDENERLPIDVPLSPSTLKAEARLKHNLLQRLADVSQDLPRHLVSDLPHDIVWRKELEGYKSGFDLYAGHYKGSDVYIDLKRCSRVWLTPRSYRRATTYSTVNLRQTIALANAANLIYEVSIMAKDDAITVLQSLDQDLDSLFDPESIFGDVYRIHRLFEQSLEIRTQCAIAKPHYVRPTG